MTTIRRTESELCELISASTHDVYTLRLQDRFGDNGIIGLAIVEHKGDEDVLETFLMSCRVLGRTVEAAFLSWLVNRSLSGKASRLTALYRQTAKNAQFADFFNSWGMQLENEGQPQKTQKWSYNLVPAAAELNLPAWIDIKVAANEGD